MRHSPLAEPDPAAPGVPHVASNALEAILDWVETHGGIVTIGGPDSNIAQLADAVCWPQRYFPECGRLVAFLHRNSNNLTIAAGSMETG